MAEVSTWYFTGSVYIGLGLTTALASGPERR